MQKQRIYKIDLLFILMAVIGIIGQNTLSQPVGGLDNWYNHETNTNTGIPFHYLWTDTEFCCYSAWGEIFRDRGARLTTIEKPDRSFVRLYKKGIEYYK